ncbi:MAG: hypothetical protein LBQ52_05125 [Helicobacteraceae bacterium]|jgi:hypothetical protein|nr:hypothetical protein [Helicobacteraceae bacterium]
MKAFLFLFFYVLGAFADDYIVSFRQVSANHTIANEKLMIAKAMLPSQFKRYKSVFSFEIGTQSAKLPISAILKLRQDDLLENLLKNGVFLSDAGVSRRSGAGAKTVLTLKATRINAVVKDDMVTIAVYEDSDR